MIDENQDEGDYLIQQIQQQKQQQQQQEQNLSISTATTSTPPTSVSSSPLLKESGANDTVENLAFNLLEKLTFTNTEAETMPPPPPSVAAQANELIPPPPCTPVSSLIHAIQYSEATEPPTYNNIFEKLLGKTVSTTPSNKPQLIIDDVLLMSREDGRPLVPLAEQELSFNNSVDHTKAEEDVEKFESIKEDELGDREATPEKKKAFMMLINKIAPHSHLVEHCFEYEVAAGEEHVHDVKLTGSFNNWQQFLPMTRDKNKWYKSLMLAPGDYEYKFVINDTEWKLNANMPNNGNNNVVNLMKN